MTVVPLSTSVCMVTTALQCNDFSHQSTSYHSNGTRIVKHSLSCSGFAGINMCNNTSITYSATITCKKHKKTASVTYRFTELLSTEAEVVYGCTRVENPSSLHAYGIQDNLPKLIMTAVSKNLSNGILLTSAPQL